MSNMNKENNLSVSESTVYVMSDDTFLGFFDADGSVLLNLDSRERNNQPVAEGIQPIGIRVYYYIGQSLSKADTVQKVVGRRPHGSEASSTRRPRLVVLDDVCGRLVQKSLPGRLYKTAKTLN